MPRVVLNRDKYLDKVQIKHFEPSIWDKITNLVSDPFKSVSETFNATTQKYRPIIFLATLAASTAITSSVVKTGVDALLGWNFSLITKDAFLANGVAGLWALPTTIGFYIGMNLLTKGTVSFPDEKVSAITVGKNIGMGYYFLRLTPDFIQIPLRALLYNQFLFGTTNIVSEAFLEDTSVPIPATNKRVHVATVIAVLATFYFGGAYNYMRSYIYQNLT